MTLMILAREFYGLKHPSDHAVLENMNKIMLVTGTMVGYAYGMEFFISPYGGNPYEGSRSRTAHVWSLRWAYWTM